MVMTLRTLIIHEILMCEITKDSLNEKKFTKSVDKKKQSCVNVVKVSLGETLFTYQVVNDVCYQK